MVKRLERSHKNIQNTDKQEIVAMSNGNGYVFPRATREYLSGLQDIAESTGVSLPQGELNNFVVTARRKGSAAAVVGMAVLEFSSEDRRGEVRVGLSEGLNGDTELVSEGLLHRMGRIAAAEDITFTLPEQSRR